LPRKFSDSDSNLCYISTWLILVGSQGHATKKAIAQKLKNQLESQQRGCAAFTQLTLWS
jgi:hypothetical protein